MTAKAGLSTEESTAWRTFMEMQEALRASIEQQLQSDSGLSSADYSVLAVLSEVPGGTMRAFNLSQVLQWEKSRLHHQLTRMCTRGLVERHNEGRTSHATITAAGHEALSSAYPAHAEHIRRLVFGRLTERQVKQLTDISRAILESLDRRIPE